MSDNTYRVIEIVGTSTSGISDAITHGIERAAQTLDDLDWFKVGQIRGHIADNRVAHYQVHLKVGFKIHG